MRINVPEVLAFFDEKPPNAIGHATAMSALFGEEMGIALLCLFLGRDGTKIELLPGPCTTGRRKGKRLDGWLRAFDGTQKTLYQVEVKNWSAHAIDGRSLSIDALPSDLVKYRQATWSRLWDSERKRFKSDALQKVSTKMKPPEACKSVKAIAAVWFATHPRGRDDPLFTVTIGENQGDIRSIGVFSMSNYLRLALREGKRILELDSDRLEQRIEWTRRMIGGDRKQ